jgi:hypothetical protein
VSENLQRLTKVKQLKRSESKELCFLLEKTNQTQSLLTQELTTSSHQVIDLLGIQILLMKE